MLDNGACTVIQTYGLLLHVLSKDKKSGGIDNYSVEAAQ